MLVSIHIRIGQAVPRSGFAGQTQPQPGAHQAEGRVAEFFLRHLALVIGRQQVAVHLAAVQVGSILHGQRHRFHRRIAHMVVQMEVRNGPAVGGEIPLEAPFSTEDLLHQHGMAAAGLAIGTVVRAHEALHTCFCGQRFKGGQVGFPKVAGRCLRVELMAQASGPE